MNICSNARPLAGVSLMAGLVLCAACGGSAPPPAVPAPASTAAPAPAPPGATATATFWETNFDSSEGWYDNKADQSYRADLAVAEGKAKLTENGAEDWGKAAMILNDLDMDRAPLLEVTVADAAGAKWGVGIVPNPWDDTQYKELIAWQETAGTQKVDLAEKTGWTGKKSVNLVILVANEGKTAAYDSMKITYPK